MTDQQKLQMFNALNIYCTEKFLMHELFEELEYSQLADKIIFDVKESATEDHLKDVKRLNSYVLDLCMELDITDITIVYSGTQLFIY